MIFLMMFHDFRFCLGIVPTHLTYKCPKCIFHMKILITELVLYNAYLLFGCFGIAWQAASSESCISLLCELREVQPGLYLRLVP